MKINLFSPLGFLYGFIMQVREKAYALGFRPSFSVPAFVLSIGNLSWGGEGKTPLTIALAHFFLRQGLSVAIITRGYKGRTKDLFIASYGQGPVASPEILGDEVFLIAQKVQAPLIISPDRVQGANIAIRDFGAQIILLDDAFQHLRIKRELDLVLFAADRNPFSEHIFPAGRLRESFKALARADAFVITKVNFYPKKATQIALNLFKFHKKIFEVPFLLDRPYPLKALFSKKKTLSQKNLSGKGLAFCGIAKPESFFLSLSSLRLNIVKKISFSDHYQYSSKSIKKLLHLKRELRADFMITTEKDAVKFEPFYKEMPDCFVLPIKADLPQEFCSFLWERWESFSTNSKFM